MPAAAQALTRTVRLSRPLDLVLTLGPLRHGTGDSTIRISRAEVWRATRTPEGPGAERLAIDGDAVRVTAWGAGAAWLLEAAAELLGESDDAEAFRPAHPLIRELARRFCGLRLPRTRAVVEALVPAVLEQKVTGAEARAAYRLLLRRYGEPAPGPAGAAGLRLPPAPALLAGLPSYALHPIGVERRRAETLSRASRRAASLERLADLPRDRHVEARGRLEALPGIGPWTAAEVARVSLGDADAVSVGDYHLPDLVSWLLAGEPRGDDARMLELLEPYRGQRARVVRLLEASGIVAPRFGPRQTPRAIAAI